MILGVKYYTVLDYHVYIDDIASLLSPIQTTQSNNTNANANTRHADIFHS